jgi:acetyl esterase/lipase
VLGTSSFASLSLELTAMASHKQPPSTMSHTQQQLSTWETFKLLATVIIIIPKSIFAYLNDLLSKRDFRSRTLRRMVVKNVAPLVTSIPLNTLRSLQKPTGVAMAHMCASEGIRHDFVQIDAGEFPAAALHFVDCDSKDDGGILLYFHGGGYIFPMTGSHFEFARMAAEAAGTNLAMLEYTLAPELQYPGQLAQAAGALRFLLKGREASQILIGGDSAGGNLALALLSHLQNPHPRIDPIAPVAGAQQALRGAFCLSPRCSNVCKAPSFTYNASKDMLGFESMQLFTSNWKPVFDEVWSTPICGDRAFWSIVKANRVLLAAGADEVYVDDIRCLADLMGAQDQPGAKVQLAVCPGEIHVQIIPDLLLGIYDGIMLNTVLGWLRSLP